MESMAVFEFVVLYIGYLLTCPVFGMPFLWPCIRCNLVYSSGLLMWGKKRNKKVLYCVYIIPKILPRVRVILCPQSSDYSCSGLGGSACFGRLSEKYTC